jgi:hypothetical protein
MGFQRQIPGGPFLNEAGYAQRQIPGGPFLNESALQFSRPDGTVASNGWRAYDPFFGGNPSLYLMLDEAAPGDDSDYIYSPTDPTTQQFEVNLALAWDPLLSVGHTLTIRFRAVGHDTAFDLDLVQGASILDSWTETITAAEGDAERSHFLTAAVADSITDYADLRLRGIARAP